MTKKGKGNKSDEIVVIFVEGPVLGRLLVLRRSR